SITPGLMNPNSDNYLAINTGFPNAYDQAHDRTGAFLMIHGGCSSSGCYAMTDELRARPRSVFRRPEVVPAAGLSLQDHPTQHGEASQFAAHGILENAQAGS